MNYKLISKKIVIEKPDYCSQNYSYLFDDKLEYVFKQRIAKEYNNVFVSTEGLVIKKGLLILGSAENLIGKYDENFYWTHLRKGLEQYIVCSYGKSLNSNQLKTDVYFSIHTPWFGYFSWLTTYLPRLLKTHQIHPDYQLIYPNEWRKINYVNELLSTLPNLSRKEIPIDHHLFVENYYLSPVRPWTSQFIKEDLLLVKNHLLNFVQTDEFAKRRIYISRKNAARRKITNEEDVIYFLKLHDFEIYCFEDLSLFDQIKLMAESSIVISSHGAGLTNLLFMPSESNVIELTPILTDFRKFRFPFWRMAKLLEMNYFAVFCEVESYVESDEYSNDITVNMNELLSVVRSIIQL